MERDEIIEKIKSIRKEIKEQELEGATAEQLAKYLVEIDKLTALMLDAVTEKNDRTENIDFEGLYLKGKE